MQALFDSFPVQFGFHATTEAAFFQAEVVGVAGEGGRRIVGATPVQLGTVKFVVHGPVLVLITRTTGGQGGGHGVLVLAQRQVEIDETDFTRLHIFFLEALAGFGEAGAGRALVVGELADDNRRVFVANGDAVLVDNSREFVGVGGRHGKCLGAGCRWFGDEIQAGDDGHPDHQ